MRFYNTYAGLSAVKLQAQMEYEKFMSKMHQMMLGEKRREFYGMGGGVRDQTPPPVEPRPMTDDDLMAAIGAVAQRKKR